MTLYISDERWAEIALGQSVELRQAASSQIVHLNISVADDAFINKMFLLL